MSYGDITVLIWGFNNSYYDICNEVTVTCEQRMAGEKPSFKVRTALQGTPVCYSCGFTVLRISAIKSEAEDDS